MGQQSPLGSLSVAPNNIKKQKKVFTPPVWCCWWRWCFVGGLSLERQVVSVSSSSCGCTVLFASVIPSRVWARVRSVLLVRSTNVMMNNLKS